MSSPERPLLLLHMSIYYLIIQQYVGLSVVGRFNNERNVPWYVILAINHVSVFARWTVCDHGRRPRQISKGVYCKGMVDKK